ncbi:MAG: PAS domain-containing protein [Nocardioidaceae bacterium]
MLWVDLDGIVSGLNGQSRTMFGLSSHDVGRPLRDLEISYRPVELRSLIERAYSERRVVRVSGVERLLGSDEVQFLDLHVQPLWDGDGLSAGVMVIFSDSTVATRLQREVKRNREELETAYEELQSTNEELETTNEELQSGNEELETMNEEMRARTTELDEARNFLEGVLSSVAVAVVVLDSELLVRSWNRGASDLSGLRSEEVQDRGFLTLDFGPRPRTSASSSSGAWRPAIGPDRWRSRRSTGSDGRSPAR